MVGDVVSRYQDTREQYARLADGDRVFAPDQTESLTVLVKRGRKVRVPLAIKERGDRR